MMSGSGHYPGADRILRSAASHLLGGSRGFHDLHKCLSIHSGCDDLQRTYVLFLKESYGSIKI